MSHRPQQNERHSLRLLLEEEQQGIDVPFMELALSELKWKNWYVNPEKDLTSVIHYEKIGFIDIASGDPGELCLYIIAVPVTFGINRDIIKEYKIKIDVLSIDIQGSVVKKPGIITSDTKEYDSFSFTHDTFAEAKQEVERFALMWLTDHRKVVKLINNSIVFSN